MEVGHWCYSFSWPSCTLAVGPPEPLELLTAAELPMAAFPDWRTIGAFTMVTVAGSSFAQLGRKVHMPLISGYIIAGAIAGPYVLRLLALDQVHTLKLVINSDAMGFIGFSAGTKFLLTELHGSLKPVRLVA